MIRSDAGRATPTGRYDLMALVVFEEFGMHRVYLSIAVVLSCGLPLHATLGQATPAQTKKVLILGVDGLRPEALLRADTPNVDELLANGCFSGEAQTGKYTVSGPGWSSMLTGVWWSKHGVIDNSFENRNYQRYPHFFTRAKEARPEIVTASFITWMPLDTHLTTDDNADFRFAHEYEDDGDAKMLLEAERVLANEDPDLIFFYFADVDIAGHNNGFHPDVPPYLEEIEEVDSQIGRLLAAIRSRPTYDNEDWLILLSTDHGGTLDGAHGRDEPQHRNIPYLASGSSAARGTIYPIPNVVDIPVTAMSHLGIDIDPAWGLDGKPSGLRSRTRFGDNLIFNGDAEYSTGTNVGSTNHGVPGWIDTGSMTVIEYGSPDGYPTSDTPGPENRGRNFFAGSSDRDCRITQTISVAEFAESIDRSGIKCVVSGWLGGFSDQRDMARLSAVFLNDQQTWLGALQIGPVTVGDRQLAFGAFGASRGGGEGEHLTGLLKREASALLPEGTRLIEIVLEAEVGTGANDGYADNLSLVLEPIIGTPPGSLGFDPFYKKHTVASGLAVISSGEVLDRAIAVAADIVRGMLHKRPDVAKALVKLNVRIAVMAPDELTTDIPEHSDLEPKDYWDKRARGLGATIARPVCSCAEENLLGYPDDRYDGESILIHEFAHTVHLGLTQVESDFDAKLRTLYDAALSNGLWDQTYAATNPSEYWAEGVQSWFDCNRESEKPNGIHNYVNTREELDAYDPKLAALIETVFDDWRWEPPQP